MFPNVRLMIVAMSASLLAIVCAMGMFAAFSVAHQPFAVQPAGRPPLQIAFGDESAMPVVDGKPSPFGVRFALNTPQTPNGPVIVAVPAGLEHDPSSDAPATAEPAAGATPESDTTAALAHDAAPVQSPSDDAQSTGSVQATKTGDVMTIAAKPDEADEAGASATIKTPEEPLATEHPAAEHPAVPPIRIVAREAENPASVNTSPAPTLAHRVPKRRKLAAHLHQSHHFRRPRIHAIAPAANQTSGYLQPNAFAQPNGLVQPNVNAYVQPNGFALPGYQYAPIAIKPKSAKFRNSASR
jgi:hypothetical protein